MNESAPRRGPSPTAAAPPIRLCERILRELWAGHDLPIIEESIGAFPKRNNLLSNEQTIKKSSN